MHAFWQLVLLLGVMLGLGSGMTALVLNAVVSNRWFEQRRGLVMGLLTASSATGQLVFLPIGTWLIEHYGWRTRAAARDGQLRAGGAGRAAVRARPSAGPRACCPTAPTPQDGLAPASVPARARVSAATPFRILASVRRDRVFWVLFASFFICGLSTNGLIQTHFISLCGDAGLGPVPAASVLAMMGAFDLVGTILSGWLSDRYDSRYLLCWYYAARGLSLAWLPSSDFTLYGLSLFAVFYGLDWIATVPPTVRLASQAFGKRARADGVRLDLRRPPAGRGGGGLWRRPRAHAAADLQPGLVHGGGGLRHRRAAGAAGAPSGRHGGGHAGPDQRADGVIRSARCGSRKIKTSMAATSAPEAA